LSSHFDGTVVSRARVPSGRPSSTAEPRRCEPDLAVLEYPRD